LDELIIVRSRSLNSMRLGLTTSGTFITVAISAVLRLGAAPGKTIGVTWRLVDAHGHAFGSVGHLPARLELRRGAAPVQGAQSRQRTVRDPPLVRRCA